MIFKVLDINEQYKFNINDAQEAIHTEVLNGEDVLDLVIPGHYNIEKKDRIAFKDRQGNWKEFIVSEIITEHSDEGLITTLHCESSFYELYGDFIEDKKPRDVTADMALLSVLESTRWEVGIVDDLGINSANFYRQSVKEAVQKIAEVWGGEIRIRIEVSGNKIVHRYIDLLTRRGNDLGKRYEYTKDIQSIKKTIQADDVITALYGFGKGEEIDETGGFGRRIDFGEIKWKKENGDPVDKPLGQKWIGLDEVKERWGRLNPDGTKSHVFGKVEFDDIEDPVELLKATWEEYQKRCEPLISYEGKVIDLKAIDGREHEGVGLGDVVTVIDKEFNPELRIKARVIQYTADLLDPTNDEVVLGNFVKDITDETIETEKAVNSFKGKQGVWDRSNIISPDLKISANYLDEIINKLNNDLNSRGGYVYLSEDGKGIITYDKPIEQDPTKAIQITGGAFRIANSKLPNGEWNWRTFGTGDGFVADLITAGKLKGGKVTFDLTNGTLLIGENTENYKLYFDGSELRIKLSSNKLIETVLTDLETGLKDYTNQKTQEAVDNIQVGGRNLIRNSDFSINDLSGWSPVYGTHKIENGVYVKTLTSDNSAARVEYLTPILEPGIYTFSMLAKSEKGFRYDRFDGTEYQRKYIDGNPNFQKSDITFRVVEPQVVPIRMYFTDPEIGDTMEIKWVKLEKGNKATDWTPAPEDVDNRIDEVDNSAKEYADDISTRVEEKITQINATVDSITSSVSALTIDIDSLKTYAESQVQLSADAIMASVTNLVNDTKDEIVELYQNAIAASASDLRVEISSIAADLNGISDDVNILKTTFRLSQDGLEIGRTDSQLKMLLSNEKLSFMDSGNEVAYVSSQKMFITEAEILNSIKVGNHVIEKYNDTITLVRWVG